MEIVAVTACPAGVAHTYMAKKGLEKAAKKMGYKIKVETQGSMGIENELKAKDLKDVNVVILAIDTKIEKASRFNDMQVHETSVAAAVKNSSKVIEDAVNKLK
ncbi:PTS fructose transporter subunit IIB [Virgibacillus necropolis]|uniref:PTS fructose transporter subunit IIB n=1 Tax=Virgibacillus necropolis TaxID=163877 RepID=A0A221M9H5_9BACI|nr:PTS fructose transporter subunit IIB [Virgibacillus necropolis]ASN04297.1 PTS fructose transporter subunit IIB [Virgibacillus necropolis]